MKGNKLTVDKILLYSITAVVFIISIYVVKMELSKSKVAYVDIGKLVADYKLRQDMEKAAGQNLYKIRGVIDSLKMVQKVSGQNEIIDTQIAHAEYAFQQYYMQSNEDISKKIWERLNPVIEEYGRKNQIELLIGANGSGSLLYGDKTRDLTQDLITYINRRYEQGN